MTRFRAFLAFLYDFAIGDDPLIAVVVVIALGATAAIAGLGASSWWVLPCLVIGVLVVSLERATRG